MSGDRSGVTPLVSVVTPFYNTAPYLAECIESVLAQTYAAWEYVLVDNWSTDGSGTIARRYVDSDARLRLLRPPAFLGLTENHNFALRQVSPQSRYCKVVQADDWIFPRCLEEMVQAAESTPNIALVGSYTLMETQLFHAGLPYGCRVLPGREMLRRYIADNLAIFGSPTCVMYRTADVLAREDFYDPRAAIDDIEACFDVLLRGDFAFVHQVLTFNRRQEQSTWATIERFEPWRLYRLILLHRHGAELFSPAEYERLRRRLESAYYRKLGQAVWQAPPREFWRFHAQGLATIGKRIERRRLAWHATRAAVDLVGNPKLTLGRALRRDGDG